MKVKTICTIAFIVGIIIILGAVGAIECNHIELKTGVIRMIIGLLICLAARFVGGRV